MGILLDWPDATAPRQCSRNRIATWPPGQTTAMLPWRRRCPRRLLRVVRALGLADIRDRPDMRRRGNGPARPALLINQRLSVNRRWHRIERLNAADVPCGKVPPVTDAFEDPQVKLRRWCSRSTRVHAALCAWGFPGHAHGQPSRLCQPSPELGAYRPAGRKPTSRKEKRVARRRESIGAAGR